MDFCRNPKGIKALGAQLNAQIKERISPLLQSLIKPFLSESDHAWEMRVLSNALIEASQFLRILAARPSLVAVFCPNRLWQ